MIKTIEQIHNDHSAYIGGRWKTPTTHAVYFMGKYVKATMKLKDGYTDMLGRKSTGYLVRFANLTTEVIVKADANALLFDLNLDTWG